MEFLEGLVSILQFLWNVLPETWQQGWLRDGLLIFGGYLTGRFGIFGAFVAGLVFAGSLGKFRVEKVYETEASQQDSSSHNKQLKFPLLERIFRRRLIRNIRR